MWLPSVLWTLAGARSTHGLRSSQQRLRAGRKPSSEPELIPRGRRPGAAIWPGELCDTIELPAKDWHVCLGQELHSSPGRGLRRPFLGVYTRFLSAIPVPHTLVYFAIH